MAFKKGFGRSITSWSLHANAAFRTDRALITLRPRAAGEPWWARLSDSTLKLVRKKMI